MGRRDGEAFKGPTSTFVLRQGEGNAARQLDPLVSPWYLMYLQPGSNARRKGSLLHDTFRRLFRVPVELFDTIVADARQAGVWPDEEQRKRGQQPKAFGA
mmetsp:Transcript_4063/g.11486  ORF Transcript_4063/g.11486 Transcript_4063/m.11486 type:complete len:100 (+) Transcript_4063:226-525(+)